MDKILSDPADLIAYPSLFKRMVSSSGPAYKPLLFPFQRKWQTGIQFHQVANHGDTRARHCIEHGAAVDDDNLGMELGDLLVEERADLLLHDFSKEFILAVFGVSPLVRQFIQLRGAGARPIAIDHATMTERDSIETGVVCDLLEPGFIALILERMKNENAVLTQVSTPIVFNVARRHRKRHYTAGCATASAGCLVKVSTMASVSSAMSSVNSVSVIPSHFPPC